MNLFIIIGCFVILVAVLVLLGLWQQRISEAEKEHHLANIREAKEVGTDKPLAQHPQIDVQACIGCGSCVAACPEDEVLGLVDGVARVIHGARCVGHGLCADVCPVAAIQIGLGELAKSPNLPILSPRFETAVPGMYIAGELGGFALIRIAVDQGTRVIDEIAREIGAQGGHAKTQGELDVLIVGAGPAGLAASLRATELGLRYLTIDQEDLGGTVRKYPRRKLTLTGTLTLPLYGRVKRTEFLKEELIELWQQIQKQFQLRIRAGVKFEGLEGTKDAFVARTSAGAVKARRVILALGRRGTPRKLGVPGEDSEKVLYQLLDASSYTSTHVLVVGGGDSAIEAATALASQPGNVVTLSYRRPKFFRLKSRNAERIREFADRRKLRVLFNSAVRSLDKTSVTLSVGEEAAQQSQTIQNDIVFVFAGGDPPYPLLRGMGVRFNGDDALATTDRQKQLVEAGA